MLRVLVLLTALLLGGAQANAQSNLRAPYFSAATTNSTLVFARKSVLTTVAAFNSTATIYYLKLYNKVTAPTCGTDVPVATFALPANGGFVLPPYDGFLFPLGIGMCITAGFANNDVAVAATGVIVNLGYRATP